MNFQEWISKHVGRDEPLGDLAKDVTQDQWFPADGGYDEIYAYLEGSAKRNIRHKVLRTFRGAWAAYAKQNGVKMPSEAEIEHKFCKQIEKLGGLALKFTPTGWSGAPDRIVLFPDGSARFVEFKVLGAEPRALQKLRLTQLHRMGFEAYVIDSMRDVEAFIEAMAPYFYDAEDVDDGKVRYDDIESEFRL